MMGQGEDPAVVAVLVAVALGSRSPGDAAQALFGGSGPVDQRAVLIAACHLLWDLAEAYSREPRRPEPPTWQQGRWRRGVRSP